MARKKKREEHENHERWLVSYADFITLLFAFFVVMYSVSSVNEGKFRVLSDALMSAFHSPPKSLEPIQVGQPSKSPVMSDLQFRSSPNILISQKKGVDVENDDGAKTIDSDDDLSKKASEDKNLGKIADDVVLAMANLIELGLINVRRNDLWLEIEIKNSILFRSGSAKLKESVIPIIQELAKILYMFPNGLRIEGYTDSKKINTEKFPSNWELSASRAASLARVFEMSNILSERLSVVGYGPTRPVADNSTPEGRSQNRRVVIVVVANNDIAKTIKRNKNTQVAPFPASENIIQAGLVDDANETDVAVPDMPLLSDDELSLYRDLGPGFVPEPSLDANGVHIINPIMASPIRLFSPIQLPQPLRKTNQAGDSKE